MTNSMKTFNCTLDKNAVFNIKSFFVYIIMNFDAIKQQSKQIMLRSKLIALKSLAKGLTMQEIHSVFIYVNSVNLINN